jgi:hypothetical protein
VVGRERGENGRDGVCASATYRMRRRGCAIDEEAGLDLLAHRGDMSGDLVFVQDIRKHSGTV